MLTIHIRGYCKHGQQNSNTTFKNKYLNAYFIVNIVTIITIFLYAINSCIIFLSKFDLIINIIPCKIYNDICAASWQIASFSKLTVFILRLETAFKGSKYEYNRRKLLIFGMFLFLQSIINVTIHVQTQYGSKYSVYDLFYACQYQVPFYVLAMGNLTDLIASSIMVYLFLKPLKLLYQKEKERQMERTVLPKHAISTNITQGTSNPTEPTTNTVTTNHDDQENEKSSPATSPPLSPPPIIHRTQQRKMKLTETQKNLKRIRFKCTILTFTATFTTFISLTIISVIESGTIVVFDYMINTFCLALMSKWYNNGDWFYRLCCGVIRCVGCCKLLKATYKNLDEGFIVKHSDEHDKHVEFAVVGCSATQIQNVSSDSYLMGSEKRKTEMVRNNSNTDHDQDANITDHEIEELDNGDIELGMIDAGDNQNECGLMQSKNNKMQRSKNQDNANLMQSQNIPKIDDHEIANQEYENRHSLNKVVFL